MGLYDRDYVRGREQGFFLGGPRTAVTDLIIVNVFIFVLDLFSEGWLDQMFSLKYDLFEHPWQCYELLTYGFLHDRSMMAHIVFNMFGLWLFGRDMESLYGRREFLRIYVSLVVLSGIVWAGMQYALMSLGRAPTAGSVVGASGAVVGIMVLYTTYYPQRIFLMLGFLPMPVWLICVLSLIGDVTYGAAHHVAYQAHLAGAAFGLIYRQTGLNWGRIFSGHWSRKLRLPRRAQLHVHQ
ncbi:MAG TPA: rhomboid family intramembrane serine protease, partial [Pirellulales bacterium]|nr:rhomboid family intramembrane serine protease [Pirellulales bacterium]